MAATYKIVRFYSDPKFEKEIVRTGLSLEEAQAHCNDPETSYLTATSSEAEYLTALRGPWFDGFTSE